MTSGIQQQVVQFCHQNSLLNNNDHLIVGVSGGPDSVCLLHILITLRSRLNLTLTIAHLNHQLRGQASQQEAAFVQAIADRYQLSLALESQDIKTIAAQRKQSLEEAARQVRYAFLWRVAAKHNATKIAVGHNANDQAETVLMHFLRGSGLSGLRGILPKVDIAGLRLPIEDIPDQTSPDSPVIIRPLLDISRADIEAYCHDHNLKPRLDASNQDTAFFRNRLRHELIPYLEDYNPQLRQVLQRTAKVITAETEILEAQVEQSWQQIITDIHHNDEGKIIGLTFDLGRWLELHVALKRATLRRAVYTLHHSLRDIGFDHIEQAINLLNQKQTGTQLTLPQAMRLIISYQTFVITTEVTSLNLWLRDTPLLTIEQQINLKLPGTTPLPQGWQVEARIISRQQISMETIKQAKRWEAYFDADIVGGNTMLRSRQPGDHFYPLSMVGQRQKLKTFMINQKIPAAQRDQIPLFVNEDKILWICGYRLDERARVKSTTQTVIHIKFVQSQ